MAFASRQHYPVGELDRVVMVVVDLRDGEAPVLIELARNREKVVAKLQPPQLALDLSRFQLHFQLNASDRRLLRDVYTFEVKVSVRARQAARLDPPHRNLFTSF